MKQKRNWLSLITSIYVILILAVHPLIFQDKYHNILNVKYYFYCVCTIGVIILTAGYLLMPSSFKQLRSNLKGKKIMQILTPTDLAVIAFAALALLSALFSDWKYEAFWGNEGRLSGAFLLTLYALAYFCVVKNLKFRSWYLDVALFSGLLVCLFGLTDFFQLDLLHFKSTISDAQKRIFTSFIGNINMYTAIVSVYMGASSIMWIACRNKWKSALYLANVWITYFALITGESENAYDLVYGCIGQGQASVTTIGLNMYTNAILNKGVLAEPHFILKSSDKRGEAMKTKTQAVTRQMCTEEVADSIKNMMVKVIKEGTGRDFAVDGVEMAFKTGTGEEGDGKTQTLLVTGGILNENKPYSITVCLNHINGGSSVNAGLIAKEIVNRLVAEE